jgi:hypothetical protein
MSLEKDKLSQIACASTDTQAGLKRAECLLAGKVEVECHVSFRENRGFYEE